MSALLAESCRSYEFLCDGRCLSVHNPILCNGQRECNDGADEKDCIPPRGSRHPHGYDMNGSRVGNDVATQIVLPTILACILLVASMLFGIKKCKQWELDRLSDMRRTRRIVQRLTARLREKNLRTIQKARDLRKRSQQALVSSALTCGGTRSGDAITHPGPSTPFVAGTSSSSSSSAVVPGAKPNGPVNRNGRKPTGSGGPPPLYDAEPPFYTGSSPPPAYEDALLDEFFSQLLPRSARSSTSSRRSQTATRTPRRASTIFGV